MIEFIAYAVGLSLLIKYLPLWKKSRHIRVLIATFSKAAG